MANKKGTKAEVELKDKVVAEAKVQEAVETTIGALEEKKDAEAKAAEPKVVATVIVTLNEKGNFSVQHPGLDVLSAIRLLNRIVKAAIE